MVATVGGLILFTSAFWWAFFFNPKSEKHRNKPRWERVVRWILFALMMAFICLLQFDVMARPLPFWPFNTEPFTLHFKDGRTF